MPSCGIWSGPGGHHGRSGRRQARAWRVTGACSVGADRRAAGLTAPAPGLFSVGDHSTDARDAPLPCRYQMKEQTRRTSDHIRADVSAVSRARHQAPRRGREPGYPGDVRVRTWQMHLLRFVYGQVFSSPATRIHPRGYRRSRPRYQAERHRVFLSDGDALTLPLTRMLDILDTLKAEFPSLQRVSAYATPHSLLPLGIR